MVLGNNLLSIIALPQLTFIGGVIHITNNQLLTQLIVSMMVTCKGVQVAPVLSTELSLCGNDVMFVPPPALVQAAKGQLCAIANNCETITTCP